MGGWIGTLRRELFNFASLAENLAACRNSSENISSGMKDLIMGNYPLIYPSDWNLYSFLSMGADKLLKLMMSAKTAQQQRCPTSETPWCTVHHMDCVQGMREMPAESVHFIATDPRIFWMAWAMIGIRQN